MKVGILTLTYDNDNFGAHLQAWALNHAILKLDPSIISGVIPLIDNPKYYIRVLEKYPKNVSFLIDIRRIVSLFARAIKYNLVKTKNLFSIRHFKFKKFFRNTVLDHLSPIYAADFAKTSLDVDVFVIGSDWVWFIPDKYLNTAPFAPGIEYKSVLLGFFPKRPHQKIIAYAASQGVIPLMRSHLLNQALKNFDAISVREEESISYFHKYVSKENIIKTVDPTLLLVRKDFFNILKTPRKKDYIAVYCLNFKFKDEFSNYVKIIQKRLHKPIIVLNMRKELYIKEAKCVGSKIGPEEFLGYIYNSAYVITNSFHGMVFASLFHKKFTAFRRSEQDFRQDNLVRMLGLENRLLSINSDDLKEKDPFFLDINWERSDCLREEGARSSWDFLKNNIC